MALTNTKGVILWFSMDGRFEYPKPIYDKAQSQIFSTDEGLDNVKYRNTRNNFLMSGMLMRRKGTAMGLMMMAMSATVGLLAMTISPRISTSSKVMSMPAQS